MPPLPGNIVRLARSPQGITLYFPALRNLGAALMLALFGLSCFIPGFFASIAIAPFADYGPGGMIALWLMSIFIMPFIGFGMLFVALAVYQVSNSLSVSVTAAEIRTRRRVFGISLGERRVASAEVAALEAMSALRYRLPREATTHYQLVVRTKRGNRKVTVAESLPGEALVERVQTEIVQAARLDHLTKVDTESDEGKTA